MERLKSKPRAPGTIHLCRTAQYSRAHNQAHPYNTGKKDHVRRSFKFKGTADGARSDYEVSWSYYSPTPLQNRNRIECYKAGAFLSGVQEGIFRIRWTLSTKNPPCRCPHAHMPISPKRQVSRLGQARADDSSANARCKYRTGSQVRNQVEIGSKPHTGVLCKANREGFKTNLNAQNQASVFC